jgi:heat shock protein HslJ
MKTILLAIFLFCFNLNGQIKNQNIKPNPLKKVWLLVHFHELKKEDLINIQAQMDLTDIEKATARMGCNTIGFKLETKKNQIKFSNVITTKMFCENKMDLEKSFVKSLSKIYTYTINGQKLILSNSKSEKMIFVAQDWD